MKVWRSQNNSKHIFTSMALIGKIVWVSEKPRVINEKQTHPQRVTVCCEFWPGGVIEPYFFENEAGRAATVNGARYRDTITQFFLPKLDNIDVVDIQFQQDDATCHTSQRNDSITARDIS